ncbi:M28 family peptidase, partial [Flavobacteriaceae bacterium]|nr:M28 family peptidase [Flavobacteriaceae bacterium]
LLTIVANLRGAQTAVKFKKIKYLGYPLSISEYFQVRNTGKTIKESVINLKEIIKLTCENEKEVIIYLSMGFGNPYGDPWSSSIILEWVDMLANMGIRIISLSDTLGTAKIQDITHLFYTLIPKHPELEFGAHFHSHPKNWYDKVNAAFNGGCKRFDGTGNVALLEMAEAFKQAEKEGFGPKRSLVFLHVTGEEKGLLGSKYYTENPLYPIKNTVANLNIDMIGRVNPKRETEDPNYIYLIGSDKLSQELHDISEAVNDKYIQLELDYTYNDERDPNRFYYRSDHYNFAKKNIPVIFYFNGTHEDYHKPTDTADKINYPVLEKRIKLIFYTAWELANRKNRIKLK